MGCEYWYEKEDRVGRDIEGRNRGMYMWEWGRVGGCMEWMIESGEYRFEREEKVGVWDVVVRGGDYVLYEWESNGEGFCCLEEGLEKGVEEWMELLY